VIRLVRIFAGVNRRLTVAVAGLAVLQGLLLPGFTLAMGALAGAVGAGRSTVTPLVAIGALFTVQRLLDPVSQELGAMLSRQVDEALTERVMRALAAPPGLAHVEDPTVLDAALQAEGALTGTTPGTAAMRIGFLLKWRVWAGSSMLIVGTYRWWLVPLLGVSYVVIYRFTRWHWYEATIVMHGATDRLRRSYYLRTLALTHTIAKETRVFGLAPWLVDRYRSSWLAVMEDIWAKRREGWLGILGIGALLVGVEGFALWLLAGDAIDGTVSVGAAVTVAQALLHSAALGEFSQNQWAMSESLIALDKLRELEQSAVDATDHLSGSRDATGLPTRAIRFDDVSFTYPGRHEPVFRGFDLEVEVGRSLAIVGENGAGKTTFVKLLARLYDPDAGRVTVDGIDLREIDPTSWHRRIAPVFQDYVELEVSAFDNVALGALHHPDPAAGVRWAAELTGAERVVGRLADGWDTVLSRSFTGGTQLSGGEWQRLALARAMFAVHAGAPILVLDEPTAAMDVRGEAEVYDRFLELTRGVTTIVISHRFSTVRRADRIVVVEHGRVVEDGSHTELMAAGGTYARMYTLQAARFSVA
jgi:ABC-type transport system involved in cytochrome bd biosynthesis fused ATPase/permease subunit